MAHYLLIGNLLSLGTVLCLAVSATVKNKKALIGWQVIGAVFCILSNIVLFAYPSAATTAVSLVRNILSYKNKLTKNITIFLTFLCIVLGLIFNNLGWVGLFPISAVASYTVFLYTTKNEQQMRYALILSMILWFIPDIYVKAYPAAVNDIGLALWTSFFAIKHLTSKAKSFKK